MQMLKKTAIALALAGAVAHSMAATVIDTGTPNGADFPLVVDDSNWLAAKLVLDSTTSTITDVSWYLNQATVGQSYTIALYGNGSSGPATSTQLFSATATYGGAGWNGLHNLSWAAGSGTYWVALESRGQGLQAEAPTTAPVSPIATAFYDGGAKYTVFTPLGFGLQVTAVPEPSDWLMMIAGLSFTGLMASRRRSAAARRTPMMAA